MPGDAPPETAEPVSSLEEAHLTGKSGKVDAGSLYAYLRDKFAHSSLAGHVPPDGKTFGINSGSPEEWARFGLAVAKQESDLNPNSYNSSDPGGSVGLFQFGQGQKQYTNGEDQFNPVSSADAFVRSVEHYVGNKGSISNLGATFGSILNPNQTLQHMKWAEKVAETGSDVPPLTSSGLAKVPPGATPASAQTLPIAPIRAAPVPTPGTEQTSSSEQSGATETVPETASPAQPPPGAALVDPLTAQEVQKHINDAGGNDAAAHDAIMEAHSALLGSDDQRVTKRTNPDTGSVRQVGQYFVEGDPVHERLLSGMGPEHRSKLPWISSAIARGEPFDYLYAHAPEEEQGAPVTAASRKFEYQQSGAQARVAGEAPTQEQLLSIIPEQMVATKGMPPDIMMEGFGSDKVLNNAQHLINGAQQAGIKTPYQSTQSTEFARDMMGYLQNQRHGYRGDGSGPVLDESGNPHRLFQADQAQAARGAQAYVPHLLDKPKAQFIHGALNIVPSSRKMERKAPSFAEHAQWIRRVNQAYAGHEPGSNQLLEELDRKLPNVPQYKLNKKTGEKEVTKHVPWTKGTLEATWRAHHVKLMRPVTAAPGLTGPLRQTAPTHLIHRAPVYRHAAAEFDPRSTSGPAPISSNPEVGAPLGEDHIEPQRAVANRRTDQIHWMPTHEIDRRWQQDPDSYIGPGGTGNAIELRYPQAVQYLAGKQPMYAPEVSVWDDGQIRFSNGRHTFSAMRDAGHKQVPVALDKESIKNAKKHGLLPKGGQPTPIDQDPMIGAPIGEDERIHQAALKYPNGKVYEGWHHAEARDRATEKGETQHAKASTGFTTTKGRFLDRKQAWEAAKRAKQVKPSGPPSQYDYLDSSDLPQPISSNPEVGSPETRFQPGPAMPGVLSAEAGAQGETVPSQASQPAPIPQDRPGASIEFVSPNIREDLSTKTAKLAFKRDQHQQTRDYHDRLEAEIAKRFGYEPAQNSDVAGDWKDGTENSIATRVPQQHASVRKLALALKGLHGAQRQVASFRHDDEGPHHLYSLELNTAEHDEARDWLTKHGLNYRTIEPGIKKGEPIWAHVIDEKGDAPARILKMMQQGLINEGHQYNGHAEFPGDPNGASREEAANRFRSRIQEARQEIREAQGRSGLYGVHPPDEELFGDFEREAEENHQKLAQSKEFKDQELAEDKRLAAIDRNNVPKSLQAERERVKQTAQDFVKANPDLPNLAAHRFINGHEPMPTGRNEDRGLFFDARNPKLDYSKAEDRKTAATALTHDIMHALAKGSPAYGWYDLTVRKAMDKFAEAGVAPELKKNKRAMQAFKLAMAVTSQGQDVFANAESAWHVYQYWRQHDEFPTDPALFGEGHIGGGSKHPAMINNFVKLNDLIDTHGYKKVNEMLHTKYPVGEMEEKFGYSPSGEAKKTKLPGSAMLGPKVGIFFQNLNGNFDPITMDLWFSRTLNRMAGKMFGFSANALRKNKGEGLTEKNKAQLTKLSEMLEDGSLQHASPEDQAKMRDEIKALHGAGPDLDRLKALELAPTINEWAGRAHNVYSKSEGLKGSYNKALKNRENLTAKNIDLNFHDLSNDPRGAPERDQWRQVIEEVGHNLKKAGIDINTADRQALLWYMEQHLFQGEDAASSADYLDAAYHIARRVKTGDLKAS